jgi:predicted nucleic acid-binding protein
VSAVFADTFFYLALLNENDSAHERAVAESKVNRAIVTSEFILLELGNACACAEDHADFLALVAGMRASPRITIISFRSTPNFSIAVWNRWPAGRTKIGR